jgi:diadenosine tetraphosphatase ApaH/serine/threonine PP2A family protein phosphatase
MRYAILGDIHSNLSALTRVLEDIQDFSVDQLLSVGDVVGYGACPAQCIDLLKQEGALVVKGNHDAACVGELDERTFNQYAKEAIRWTRSHLSKEHLDWLRQLPLEMTLEHCQVAHGSIDEPAAFDYIRTTRDADPSLESMIRPVAFVGHTHMPIALMRLLEPAGATAYSPELNVDLKESDRCLVNVGSVGQPRDEDHRTGWVLFDSEAQTIALRRLEYDMETAARRIRDAGLPRMLADRLYLGV